MLQQGSLHRPGVGQLQPEQRLQLHVRRQQEQEIRQAGLLPVQQRLQPAHAVAGVVGLLPLPVQPGPPRLPPHSGQPEARQQFPGAGIALVDPLKPLLQHPQAVLVGAVWVPRVLPQEKAEQSIAGLLDEGKVGDLVYRAVPERLGRQAAVHPDKIVVVVVTGVHPVSPGAAARSTGTTPPPRS